jgi:aminoglycoside N3'-acetyltransferase
MSEADLIARPPFPLTAQSLAEQLRACGLRVGQTVLVHMALSRLGWVVGGAEAAILAFLDVLGPAGTLMMPTLPPTTPIRPSGRTRRSRRSGGSWCATIRRPTTPQRRRRG